MGCRAHKAFELQIGDRITVDPETVHRDTMRRCLFGIMLVRAHLEIAFRDPDHSGGALQGMAVAPVGRHDLAFRALEYFWMRRTRAAEPAQHRFLSPSMKEKLPSGL
jgi:hypothetical protein